MAEIDIGKVVNIKYALLPLLFGFLVIDSDDGLHLHTEYFPANIIENEACSENPRGIMKNRPSETGAREEKKTLQNIY